MLRYQITQQQIDHFYNHGLLVIKNLFTASEIESYIHCAENIYRTAKDLTKTGVYQGSRFVFQGEKLHRVVWCGAQENTLLDVGADSRIITPVSQILNSNELHQLINQLHYKMPGDQVKFSYHQDAENRGYGTSEWRDIDNRGSYVQTALCLDPMKDNNGPFEYIPESSKQGYLDLHGQAESKIDLSKLVTLTMDPGDLALFGPYTVHGSQENRSASPRRVLINGYALPGANSKNYPGCNRGRIIKI